MASKKLPQAELAELARIKATKAKPSATTPPTPPPSPPTTIDWRTWRGDTTTTTAPPATTTVPSTTVPTTVAPPIVTPVKEEQTLSEKLESTISKYERELIGKYTPEDITKIKKGEKKPEVAWWKRALGATFTNPLAQPIVAPLKAIAWAGRIGVSSFEEGLQAARGAQKYEATDYIPKHPQTGKPIAKVGDPVIRNDEEILKSPIDEKYVKQYNAATTDAEKDAILTKATNALVNENKRTAAGSWSEWARQIGTPNEFRDYGFGDIAEVQLGRHLVESGKVSPAVGKWIDRTVGFGGDVLLDPTTYLSMGTTTAAKTGTRALGGGAELFIDMAVDDLAEVGLKEATKRAAKQVAELTGEKVGARSTQATARAVVAEAAKVLKEAVLTGDKTLVVETGRRLKVGPVKTTEQYLDDLISQSSRQWSAIAPRREIGAGARQATASMVQDLRDEAADFLGNLHPTASNSARARAAQNFLDVINDDVIKDIAVRGNAAIKGEVARALSTPGGLRWGIGKYKVSIPKSEIFTRPLSSGFTYPRRLLSATQPGRRLIDVTTRVGQGGLFGDEYIFNWRTGLRSGYNAQTGRKLTGEEAVTAVKSLAEDQVYRALKKTTSQTIKQGVDSVFKIKEFRPYFNTVHEIITNPAVNWSDTAENIARTLGRPLDEVRLAMRVRDLGQEFALILEQLSGALRGNPVVFPDDWFPEALSDKAVIWLNKNTPAARDALRALGLTAPPASGRSIAEKLVPGLRWFGHQLTDDDIAAGISRFNYLANNPINGVKAFKGEFFDTNAASAIEKYARKFADDYAFLRNVVRGDLERFGGGARATMPTIYTAETMAEWTGMSFNRFLDGAVAGLFDSPTSSAAINLAEKLNLDPEDIVSIAQQLKRETDSADPSYMDWLFDDAGDLAMEAVESRFNYLLIQKRLNNLIDSGEIGRMQAAVSGRRAEILRTPVTERNRTILEDQQEVLRQVQMVLDSVYEEMLVGGKSAEDFLLGIDDTLGLYLESLDALFAQTPENFARVVDNINPNTLNAMVNMTEDAFVKLDNIIVPDIYAQREIAQLYSNVRRLKEPKFQNGFIRFMRNYNRYIKTWVTNTPGFHLRNLLSNGWQMVATGAEIKNLNESLRLMNAWESYVKTNTKTVANIEQVVKDILDLPADIDVSKMTKDVRKLMKLAKTLNVNYDDVLNMKFMMEDMIARGRAPRDDWRFLADWARVQTRLQDPEIMFNNFIDSELLGETFTRTELEAFRDTMMWTGAAGFGDVEEVFGAAVPSRLGITGAEVPVRTSTIGRAASRTSQTVGAIPRASRSFGGKIENYSRFMLTYDGIRQGLTPEQAAARTARYLVDYEDLTKLDEVAKLVFPFWMWMSRNLPVQTANMFMNPKAYAIYQNFRENFEDKDGRNPLLPSYLKEAGVFKIPFGENIYAKPDLGFPGAGSPSPLQTGVTDWRSLLSAMPLASLGAAATGTELYSGRPLEGAGEIIPEILGQILPPVSTAGRYASGLGAAGRDLPGPEWAQEVLGVKGPRESGANAQTIRALASLLGIPLTTVGPDQENIARYEIIEKLQPFLDALRMERGTGG